MIFGSRSFAILAVMMAVFLFRALCVAIKIALVQVDPLTLIPIRFGLGLIVLWLIMAAHSINIRPNKAEIVRTAILGGLGILFNQWFQADAMVTAGATTASWLATLAPAFMVILAWTFLC